MRGQNCHVCTTAVDVAVRPATDIEGVDTGACVATSTDVVGNGIVDVDFVAAVEGFDVGAVVGVPGEEGNATSQSSRGVGDVGDCMEAFCRSVSRGCWQEYRG